MYQSSASSDLVFPCMYSTDLSCCLPGDHWLATPTRWRHHRGGQSRYSGGVPRDRTAQPMSAAQSRPRDLGHVLIGRWSRWRHRHWRSDCCNRLDTGRHLAEMSRTTCSCQSLCVAYTCRLHVLIGRWSAAVVAYVRDNGVTYLFHDSHSTSWSVELHEHWCRYRPVSVRNCVRRISSV